MKIIFLDFDGVITSYYTKYRISKDKIKLIENLINETGAKIVISSSWRHGSKNVEEFINKNLSEISDSIFVKSIIGLTEVLSPVRGEEIQKWIDDHNNEIESYVILDDDSDMLDEQLYNFVQTDGYEGITEREIRLSKHILNKEYVPNNIRLNCELYFRYRKKIENIHP